MEKLLEEIASHKKKFYVLLKNKDNRSALNKWLKVELTYTSNAIEGNTLTRKETSLAIEENITSGSKPINDYLEALNHAKAYDFIVDFSRKDLEINEEIVVLIHKLILSGIDDVNAGFYRSVRVRISGSNTILPNPLKVPELMEDFSMWLMSENDDSVIKAIEAHYRLVSIHPFVDGNGRTARLLMNLILMKSNYCPIIIRPIDRKRYLSSLEIRQTKEESETYTRFMLTALNRSLKTIINALDIQKEDFNQNKLLTISKFAELVGLPISTIRYWVEIGKIEPVSYRDSGYMLFDPEQKDEIDTILLRKSKL